MDYVILGFIILSMALGLWRGFVKETISFVSWICALIVAFIFIDDGVAYLTRYINVVSVRIVLAFGFFFISTLIVGGLVNLIVVQLSSSKQVGLNLTDRFLGLGFGFLRGIVASAVLVLLAGLTPLPGHSDWINSSLLLHFQESALWLRSFFPQALAENFKFP